MGRQKPRDQKEWKRDSEGQERSKNAKKEKRWNRGEQGDGSREEQREEMSKEG